MLSVGELVASLTLDTAGMDRALTGAQQKLSGLGKALGGLGLTASVTRPLVKAAKESIAFGNAFEAQMDRVSAVMNLEGLGASAEEAGVRIEALRETALRMGETTSLSAAQAAEAMENLAMAGWKDTEIEKAIAPLIRLSEVAGTGDLAGAAGIVADSLTALGEGADSAGRLADVLTATATGSNTDLTQLGTTFRYVAGMAGSLGFSMEDLALASGLMANSGIKAQKAGTGLRAMLNRMSSNKSAQKVMEDLGVSLYDTGGKARSLREVLVDLRGAFASLTEEEKVQSAYLLAGTSGMNTVLALTGATEESFIALRDAIDGAEGSAARAAGQMLDNLAGDLTLLDSALGTTKIRLAGTAEAIGRSAVQALTGLVNGLNGLSSGTQGASVKLLGLAAALGPAISGLGLLETAAASLLPGMLSLISPAGLLTSGLVALGAAALSSEGDLGRLIKEMGRGAAEALQGLEGRLEAAIAHIDRELPGLVSGLSEGLETGIRSTVSLALRGISSALTTLSAHMPEIREIPLSILRAVTEAIRDHAGELVQGGADLAAALISGLLSSLPALAESAGELALALIRGIREIDFGRIAGELREGLQTALTGIVEGASGFLDGLSEALALPFREGEGTALAGAQGLGRALRTGLGETGADTLSAFSGLGNLIRGALESAFSSLGDLGETLLHALSGIDMRGVTAALSGLAGEIGETLATALAGAFTLAGDLIAHGLTGLSRIDLGGALTAMADLGARLVTALGEAVQTGLGSALQITEAIAESLKRIDWEKLGSGIASLATEIVGALGDVLATLDLGDLITGVLRAIGAAGEGIARAAGQLLLDLFDALTAPGALSRFADVGIHLVENILSGVLRGISGLADAVLRGISGLLSPAISRLFGGGESLTGEIELFRETTFQLSPTLYASAERTGRELENLTAKILSSGIPDTGTLRELSDVAQAIAGSAHAGMLELMDGLKPFARTGFVSLYEEILSSFSTGEGMERAGQEAALLWMSGFSDLIGGSLALQETGEIRDAVMESLERALQDFGADGLIDVGDFAASLSSDLSDVLGFSLPEGYRLAFNGAETELQRITEEGFRTVVRSAGFGGLFASEGIWEEVQATTLAALGDLAGTMAGIMDDAGLSAGEALGHSLSRSAAEAIRGSLERGDTQGALATLLADFGLQGAGEQLAGALSGAESQVTQAAESLLSAADPGEALAEVYREAGSLAGSAAAEGLTGSLSEMEEAGETIAQAADPGESMAELFSESSLKATQAAVEAVGQGTEEMTAAVEAFSSEAVAAFAEGMTEGEGMRIAQGFVRGAVQGVGNGRGPLVSAASALAGGAVAALSSALSASSAYSLGSRFAQGLASGLRSGVSSVSSAAAALSSAGSSAVRTAWRIHSPSRVAEEMGSRFVEGLVLGLDGETELTGAMKQLSLTSGTLARSLLTEAAAPMALPLANPSSQVQGSESTPRETDLTAFAEMVAGAISGMRVEMDGEHVGEVVAPTVSRLISEAAKSRRFG